MQIAALRLRVATLSDRVPVDSALHIAQPFYFFWKRQRERDQKWLYPSGVLVTGISPELAGGLRAQEGGGASPTRKCGRTKRSRQTSAGNKGTAPSDTAQHVLTAEIWRLPRALDVYDTWRRSAASW